MRRFAHCLILVLAPSSVAWADGLVDIAPGTTIKAGDTVAYLPLSDLIELA